VCAVAVAFAAGGAPADAAFGRALLELLIVGVPIAAGLYALRAPRSAPFGYALYGVGLAWSLTALGESSDSVPYTIGRLSNWLVFPCVVFLLLAFPRGRIAPGLDRVLMVGVLALSVVLFYGTAPIVTAYPAYTPWATCTTECPANAVALVAEPPSFLPRLILVREWLVMALWAGLAASMARRWRAASPLLRRAMTPVFLAAAALGACHVSFHLLRQLGAPADVVRALASAWTLCIVAVCAAFLFGLLWQRILLASSLRELGLALRRSDEPAAVRGALVSALRDPSVDVVYRDSGSGGWRGSDGRTRMPPPAPEAGRAATPVHDADGTVGAVLVHDAALCDDPELLEGVAAIVFTAWRHDQLKLELSRAAAELDDSRRRLAEQEGADRARLEQDLHDGAQQSLFALRLRLADLARRVEGSPLDGEIADIVRVADVTAEEIRRIGHGIYPPILAERGIADALRALPAIPRLPVEVEDAGLGRLPAPSERALYYASVEAIQNAAKHAQASRVRIRLGRSEGAVHVTVSDDGRGFDPTAVAGGVGITGMRDRIEAIGGAFALAAAPGRGTSVRITLPLDAVART
jgi:signal transduction histidine kinase